MPETDLKRELEEDRKLSKEMKYKPKGIEGNRLERKWAKENGGNRPAPSGEDRTSETEHRKNLALSRKNNAMSETKQMAATAKTMAQAATPMGALSLVKQVDFSKDLAYVPAILAAMLKDILDFIGIGSLPAIGTVITICVSIFIFFMLLMAGANGQRKTVSGMWKRSIALAGGTMAEMLFGLNFFPIETAVVGVIYLMALSERKQEAKNQ